MIPLRKKLVSKIKKSNKPQMKHPHFLITSFPIQGHINPTLQLAKNLAALGATVTFATTAGGLKRIQHRLPALPGLSYASFSESHDDQNNPGRDTATFLADLRRFGSESLTKILQTSFADGRPVTCLVYSLLMPWVSTVARSMHIPSAFLAIQCAAAFAIYSKFFSRHDGIHERGTDQGSISVSIQDLPTFSRCDLPTFILPEDPMSSAMGPMMLEHFRELESTPESSLVLLNTFQELEQEGIKALEKTLNVIPIGPLIPSALFDGDDATDKSFGGDLLISTDDQDYFEWLDSKPERSVVYVAFGSLVATSKEQKIEVLHGLVQSKRPFLWVIRSSDGEEMELMKKMVENDGDGMIVAWCLQTQVLRHKSVGCFVTHCGWNSTLESLVCGVPLVGCPHFSDQTTNAKLVEEVWGNGVRARANGEVVIKREDLRKCLDVVMGDGERGEEIRKNALKWRGLAVEAVKDGGSTYSNLRKVYGEFMN